MQQLSSSSMFIIQTSYTMFINKYVWKAALVYFTCPDL